MDTADSYKSLLYCSVTQAEPWGSVNLKETEK